MEKITPPIKQKIPTVAKKETVDLDRLAYCVAKHETINCSARAGAALVNNCFGIMSWTGGKRHYKRYNAKEDSYKDFKRIWSSYYGGFPTMAQAKRYTGNDRANQWLATVRECYYNN